MLYAMSYFAFLEATWTTKPNIPPLHLYHTKILTVSIIGSFLISSFLFLSHQWPLIIIIVILFTVVSVSVFTELLLFCLFSYFFGSCLLPAVVKVVLLSSSSSIILFVHLFVSYVSGCCFCWYLLLMLFCFARSFVRIICLYCLFVLYTSHYISRFYYSYHHCYHCCCLYLLLSIFVCVLYIRSLILNLLWLDLPAIRKKNWKKHVWFFTTKSLLNFLLSLSEPNRLAHIWTSLYFQL